MTIWIAFGSKGRKEQAFKTDQDNAIIYADPETTEEGEIRRYFSIFTSFVRDSLIKVGFPLCPSDCMASNPHWCQPLKAWKRYSSGWINGPTADAVLKSLILFDSRTIYGIMVGNTVRCIRCCIPPPRVMTVSSALSNTRTCKKKLSGQDLQWPEFGFCFSMI